MLARHVPSKVGIAKLKYVKMHDYDAQITNNNATLASQQVSFSKLVTIVMLIINEP